MKHLIFVAAITATVLAASPAFAHGGATTTNIKSMANLAEAPATFELKFENPSAVTTLTLTGPDKKIVDLGFKPSKELSKTFSIPLPKLAKGKYALGWASTARDGHAEDDGIEFTIVGK